MLFTRNRPPSLERTLTRLNVSAFAGAFILSVASFVVTENLGLVTSTLSVVFIFQFVFFLNRAKRSARASLDVIGAQASELRATNVDLEVTASLIRETLSSVDETFLLIGPDGVCFASPSARAESVIGFAPEGRHLCDILRVPATQTADVTDWLKLLFSERVPFDSVVELGPARVVVDGDARTYRVKYFPMRGETRLENVIVTLLDVTDSLRERAARDEAEARSKFILAVAQHRDEFALFAREFYATCDRAPTLEHEDLRTQLHTHKGTASVFYVRPVVAAIHAFELRLEHADLFARAETTLDLSLNLPRVLSAYLETERTALKQLRVFEGSDMFVAKSVAVAARLRYRDDAPALAFFDDVMSRLGAREVGEVLRAFEPHVRSLAEGLGKQIQFEVAPDSDFCALLTDHYQPICTALVHLLNNAVDHGLESPPERLRNGKSPAGSLRVSVHRGVDDWGPTLEIRVRDDGRGIDPDRVRAALAKRGLDVSNRTDAEILDRVFDLGLSTRAGVTDVSGLGVGLSGLRSLVVSAGGTLTVTSRLGRGTQFNLRLPAPDHLVWFSVVDLAWSVAAA